MTRQNWDAANELELFLRDNEYVLRLLADGHITLNRCIEALCIIRAGNRVELPSPDGSI